MKWLEIIELCSASAEPECLQRQVVTLAERIASQDTGCRISVFRNGLVESATVFLSVFEHSPKMWRVVS